MSAPQKPAFAPVPADRLYPARPIPAASIALFREGRVLIATRTKPPGAGVWSLPGGLVEPGETLEAAALRELFEEVGSRGEILGFNRHVERIELDEAGRVRQHYIVASFVGRWLSGEPQAGPEAGEVRWADPRDLGQIETTPMLREVLAGAARIEEAFR